MGKLDNIITKTGFSLEDIKKMSDKDFFSNITRQLAKGSISKEQHDWLNKQRYDKDVQEVLEIFGGQLL